MVLCERGSAGGGGPMRAQRCWLGTLWSPGGMGGLSHRHVERGEGRPHRRLYGFGSVNRTEEEQHYTLLHNVTAATLQISTSRLPCRSPACHAKPYSSTCGNNKKVFKQAGSVRPRLSMDEDKIFSVSRSGVQPITSAQKQLNTTSLVEQSVRRTYSADKPKAQGSSVPPPLKSWAWTLQAMAPAAPSSAPSLALARSRFFDAREMRLFSLPAESSGVLLT
ncbi:hypothetical protein EYF80_048675 [Liparis tanakae]|uniref:Uncharacterized protein n=1 Tax=Liparis tanakae TaxID=230148 RepID=A0A4Z2FJQ3_9TELE|nr:hypothetical protein EYF80_048675 [Liparis tanakae]